MTVPQSVAATVWVEPFARPGLHLRKDRLTVRVLGESEVSADLPAKPCGATAGSGLTPLIQEAYSERLKALQGLLSGSLSPTLTIWLNLEPNAGDPWCG